ncbi:MAG TPA: hypothetical protein VHZ54_16435 [Solirubrobacterales bacterium]|jgi:hypothetical protein|nr:hypothetical protein [Solirubrobacterales bacterium]
MGVLGAILLILALKIPIVGLITFVYWLMKEPTDGADAEKVRAKMPPRLPDLGDRRPRRRGPHGGAARPLPSPRRDPHPAAAPVTARETGSTREGSPTPRGSAPGPLSRST